MGKIRVLITDDHDIVRSGLKQLLNDQPDMEVIGEARDGREALDIAKFLHPDVVTLDLTMPNLDGLEAAALIREVNPRPQMVIFTMHAKSGSVRQVLASGALGYVLKASPMSDILKAIKAVHRGEYYLSSNLNSEVIHKYVTGRKANDPVNGYDFLTDREQQVFCFVAKGHSTDQIADVFCISIKTVEKHRSSIMRKLNIHDRFKLLKYAIKIGIVDPELWED